MDHVNSAAARAAYVVQNLVVLNDRRGRGDIDPAAHEARVANNPVSLDLGRSKAHLDAPTVLDREAIEHGRGALERVEPDNGCGPASTIDHTGDRPTRALHNDTLPVEVDVLEVGAGLRKNYGSGGTTVYRALNAREGLREAATSTSGAAGGRINKLGTCVARIPDAVPIGVQLIGIRSEKASIT